VNTLVNPVQAGSLGIYTLYRLVYMKLKSNYTDFSKVSEIKTEIYDENLFEIFGLIFNCFGISNI
jgi:hypothetical protein